MRHFINVPRQDRETLQKQSVIQDAVLLGMGEEVFNAKIKRVKLDRPPWTHFMIL